MQGLPEVMALQGDAFPSQGQLLPPHCFWVNKVKSHHSPIEQLLFLYGRKRIIHPKNCGAWLIGTSRTGRTCLGMEPEGAGPGRAGCEAGDSCYWTLSNDSGFNVLPRTLGASPNSLLEHLLANIEA